MPAAWERTDRHIVASRLLACFFAVAVQAAATCAIGQGWPARAVRWIVPFPPGGATDLSARLVSQKLSDRLKQPVVIDNRPGAASLIGMEAAAKSAPDGYTILFVIPNLVTSPVLFKTGFDPFRDLAPVIQLTGVYFVMVVNNSVPVRSLSEFIGLARERPGTMTCASGGGLSQLACEWLKSLARVDITLVPYKGLAPAWTDLLSGQVSMMFDITSTALPHLKANRARAIATTVTRRGAGYFGEMPTISETYPEFEINSWQGVMAPAGTPREIVVRLNREIAAILGLDDVVQRLAEIGLEPAPGTPEAFGALIQRDHAKYSKIIREAGIRTQ